MAFLNFFLPHLCYLCKKEVKECGLCMSCWQELHFLSPPWCDVCGLPFDFAVEDRTLCGSCLKNPPLFKKARSVFAYTEKSRPIPLRFKHQDATYMGPLLIKWMREAHQDLFLENDILLPVPLHWLRMLKRTYNQAALIAHGLAKQTKLPYLPEALKRVKMTKPQQFLTRGERTKNVKKAFKVAEKYKVLLKGKNILLIDDVYTSGSTLKECTKALLKAEVKSVSLLTFTRAIQPEKGV